MWITDITSQGHFRVEFFAEVQTYVSGGGDTVSGSSRPSTPSSSHTGEHVGGNIGESHIVRVIDTSHKCELVVVDKPVHHEITFIPILASIAGKGITEPSLLHSWLDGQVDHGFFIPVIESGHPCHIAQAVQHLYFFHHFRRQVFGSYFRVVGEEFFSVYQYFLDFFSIDGNLSFAVNFHAGHLFQQVFQDSPFGCLVRVGVIFDRVVADDHFRSLADHDGFTQLDSSVA